MSGRLKDAEPVAWIERGLIAAPVFVHGKPIPTWRERCETHPDHRSGMVSHEMIAARMQEEIDELRAALAEQDVPEIGFGNTEPALEAVDKLVESARLLGVTQAKKGFGYYTQEDARMERAWHESIVKHSRTIRAELAEQDPEPAGWLHMDHKGYEWFVHRDEKDEADTCPDCHPVYRNPPRREWVGLTDEEIDSLVKQHIDWIKGWAYADLCRAIEAALKEKNT